MATLEQKITSYIELGNELPELPAYIKNNLNPNFELRPYQIEAFSRFIYYLENSKLRQKPAQLLYHMATGSGKTLIMAGAMLYLYQKGYRNFLFFVNSTNIINKTRDNFLNTASTKYLFNENIFFGDKQVQIKETDSFQAVNENDINIIFTTIHGLHSRLNLPRENSITYDDFENKKVVLLSDEAHHINVETKTKKTKGEQDEILNWEYTVNTIFRSSPENILLEFTATADLNNLQIANKYQDKLLFDYSLKQFRIDLYSKEVKVLELDDDSMFKRSLIAVILSQYRRKIFEKNRQNIKPVILFKSNKIDESQNFHAEFIEKINSLTISDLEQLKQINSGVIKKCFKYFEENNISLDNLINELKNDFSADKCIEINSKEESEIKQLAVNTLEDTNNEFRAVFAVDKLNEGWDVLNLFDIVRLYNTRDGKSGKPGKTTMAEAQLIGRGARYCPFKIEDKQAKYQRKYDEDTDNDLRICEEMYYHSTYNPQYIQELNTALVQIGLKARESTELQLELKLDFQNTDFYTGGLIFLNNKIKRSRNDIKNLPSSLVDKIYHYDLQTGFSKTITIFERAEAGGRSTQQKDYRLVDFGYTILKKALSRLEFYYFCNLKKFLPNLKSVDEFIISASYLQNVKLEIDGDQSQISDISAETKLNIAIDVLNKISLTMQSESVEFEGTKEFFGYNVNKVFKNKTLNICLNETTDQEYGRPQAKTTNQQLYLDLSKKDWYAFNENYGTSEEKFFVKHIDKVYNLLKDKYSEIYLVRNEKHFQIYSFDDGKAFEPDFVLFLKEKYSDETLYYQIFIEPKGGHLIKEDEWKEVSCNTKTRCKNEHFMGN